MKKTKKAESDHVNPSREMSTLMSPLLEPRRFSVALCDSASLLTPTGGPNFSALALKSTENEESDRTLIAGMIMEAKKNYNPKTADELSLLKGQLVEVVRVFEGGKYCEVRLIFDTEAQHFKGKLISFFYSSKSSQRKATNGVVPSYTLRSVDAAHQDIQYDFAGIGFLGILSCCICKKIQSVIFPL